MKRENILYNTKFVVLLSVLLAFISWVLVAMDSEERQGRTVKNVPVNMEEVESTMGRLGLRTISSDQQQVNVYVEGVIYDIGGITADDIEVKPDISQITAAGTYDVELTGTIKDRNAQVTVTSISPRTIQMKFDSLQTKTIEIEDKVTGLSAPEDYLIRNVSLSPSTVTVTGPEEDISRIASCVAETTLDEQLTSTYSGMVPIKFLDKDGNVLENLRYVTSDVTEVQMSIPVLKKKIVPVTVELLNVPEGFPADQLKFTYSNDEIEIAGPEDQIDRYKEVVLGTINMKNLGLDSVYNFEVKLRSDFVNTKNIQNIKVTFDSTGLTSKQLNGVPVSTINEPLNYETEVITTELNNVEVIGPQKTIEALVAGDVWAVVDLQEQSGLESGQMEFPVKFSVPGKGLVWVKGDYQAIVSLKDTTESAS